MQQFKTQRLKTFEDLFKRISGVNTVPASIESERSILGAMMIDTTALTTTLEHIGKRSFEDSPFFSENHTLLYLTICTLVEIGRPVDYMSVWQEMGADLQQRIPLKEMVTLADSIISTVNIEEHIRVVLEKHRLRELIAISKETELRAYLAEPFSETMEKHESHLFNMRREEKGKLESIGPHVTELVKKVQDHTSKEFGFGLTCGISELDKLTGGAKKGQMRIIAARPSQGKSALAVTVALGIAMNKIKAFRTGVAIFSLEMTTLEIVLRMLANLAKVDSSMIERNHMSDGDWKRVLETVPELIAAPIFIDDSPGLTPLELKSRLRRMKMKHQIDHVIIDYLQIMQPGVKLETREREVSYISSMLKNMAKELGVSIDVLSQLNRAMELRADKRPALSDLRESGSLEQDAHVVIMPYYPERKGATVCGDAIENVELMVLKNRNGKVGTVPLQFNKPFSLFEAKKTLVH